MFGFYLVHREVVICSSSRSIVLSAMITAFLSLSLLLTADMPLMITAGPSMVGVPPPGGMVPPGMMPGAPTAFPGQQPGFYGQY